LQSLKGGTVGSFPLTSLSSQEQKGRKVAMKQKIDPIEMMQQFSNQIIKKTKGRSNRDDATVQSLNHNERF
jgi:hypothetical protein